MTTSQRAPALDFRNAVLAEWEAKPIDPEQKDLAKHLCQQDQYHPDSLIDSLPMAYLAKVGGRDYRTFNATWMPIWAAYLDRAREMIEYAKERNSRP